MSRFLDNDNPRILPKVATPKISFLNVITNLEKIALIEENMGGIARNAKKLNLSNSIYERSED